VPFGGEAAPLHRYFTLDEAEVPIFHNRLQRYAEYDDDKSSKLLILKEFISYNINFILRIDICSYI
jgi:hypothetical protein